MKRKYVLAGLLIFLLFIVKMVTGVHFTIASLLPDNSKIVLSQETAYGKAVLYEKHELDTFGIARIEKVYSILYRYDGGSKGEFVEKGKPFAVAGLGSHRNGEESFIAAIKTAKNANIAYIAIGNHLGRLHTMTPYTLSLEDVRAHPNDYDVLKVSDHYALFAKNDFDFDNKWYIHCFDSEGNLVADKLHFAKIRYVD